MSAVTSSEQVARSLRPVVVVVVATKMAIVGFLFASVAGLVPAPAVAEQSATVYFADSQPAE
jgi:hypothetical protein